MDMDLNRTVSSETVFNLNLSEIIIISAIIVLMFVFFKRYRARFIPLLAGILGFVVFILIGNNLISSMIFSIPGVNTDMNNNKLVLQIISYAVYALLFTLARVLIGKYLFINYNRPGDVLMFGLGTGICEAIICVISSMSLSIWAMGINNTGLTEILKNMSETDMTKTYDSISILFNAPSILWILLGLSIVMDILLNCGLAVIVYGAVTKKLSSNWYVFSALINFFVIIPFKIYDETSYNNIVLLFAIKTIFLFATAYIVYRVDLESVGGIISYNVKRDNQTTSMPKLGSLRRK